MDYDVVIVGAGSAGCVLAARLSERSQARILLLEAGPDYASLDCLPHDIKWGGNYHEAAFGSHDWGYVAWASPDRQVPLPRGRVTGGTSAINSQFMLRALPEDYDDWAAAGNTEWSYEKVLPYLRKLEKDAVFNGVIHGSDGPIPIRRLELGRMTAAARGFYEACLESGFKEALDHNSPTSNGIGPVPLNNEGGVRISTALAYLASCRSRHNLTIASGCNALRILFRDNRAVGVEVEHGKQRLHVMGRQIVVSAGAIASPQLLMLSGIGPHDHLAQTGVEVRTSLSGVGSNLRDHPYVPVMFEASGKPPDYEKEPYVQAVLRYTSPGSTRRNDMQIGHSSLDMTYMPKGTGLTSGSYVFSIFANIQDSRNVGSVRLRSVDPRVQPEVQFNYLNHEDDRRRLREAVRLILSLTERSAFVGRILDSSLNGDITRDGDALNAWIASNIGTAGYHASGSCKMGPPDDEEAVVDQYCRVRSLDGLRVVDASVMPSVIRANTNLTTIMIAERVADFIKDDLPT